MEKIKIRGLLRISGCVFVVWGIIVFVDGILDALVFEPETNKFSLYKWEFITLNQWETYARFEIVYGIACILVALLIWKFAPRVPDFIDREKKKLIEL